MGISSWPPLLVYQWDDLSGPGARKVGKEDENMPTMQGVPKHAAVSVYASVFGLSLMRKPQEVHSLIIDFCLSLQY
jgi:hypothetical protein